MVTSWRIRRRAVSGLRQRPSIRAFGCEWSETAAQRAASKSGVSIVRGTINALPFGHANFDAVIVADVLCHAAVQPRPALAELGRVLRPGGRLVINMPAFEWLLSVHDRRVHNVRRVTAAQLRAVLAAAGFHTIRVHYWNSLLLPLMVAHRMSRSRRRDGASDVRLLPVWLNAALYGITAVERFLPVKAPAGGSVIATAVRVSE